MKQIKFYIIVGFLGSGKTTLLKNLIEQYKNQKIGVIINDFGQQNIDATLLSNELRNIQEVSNGSLFCSCKSDQFIDKLIEYSKTDLDIVFVEGSGIANPNTIIKLLDLITLKTSNIMNYNGTIGIVDASTLHKVISTNMVINQIVYSDLLLINKKDKVTDQELINTIDLVRKFNTRAAIIPTTFSIVEKEVIDNVQYSVHNNKVSHKIDLNVQKIELQIDNASTEQLRALCNDVFMYCSRIKGFINMGNTKYIEYIHNELVLYDVDFKTNNVIVFISVSPINLKEIITASYQKIFKGTPIIL